jgi:hypothetical protein
MLVSALVKVACRRWTIEESFAASKELAALDEHQAALRSCRRPSLIDHYRDRPRARIGDSRGAPARPAT